MKAKRERHPFGSLTQSMYSRGMRNRKLRRANEGLDDFQSSPGHKAQIARILFLNFAKSVS
jgi:hypothetical protein